MSQTALPTKVLDPPNALEAEWQIIPAAWLQHVVESLKPRRVVTVKAEQRRHVQLSIFRV